MSYSGELYDIIEDAKKELQEWIEENPKMRDIGDRISEITDESVPIYNYDLMMIGAENLDLAVTAPEMEGDGSAVNAMQLVVYDAIYVELNDYVREIERDAEDCIECGEKIYEWQASDNCVSCGEPIHDACFSAGEAICTECKAEREEQEAEELALEEEDEPEETENSK